MSYPKCPECEWAMIPDVRVASAANLDLERGAIWRCSNPDCDHVQEQNEQSIC